MNMKRYGQSLNYVKSSVNRQHLAPRATCSPIRHASEQTAALVAAEAIIAEAPSVRCKISLQSVTCVHGSSSPPQISAVPPNCQRRWGYQKLHCTASPCQVMRNLAGHSHVMFTERKRSHQVPRKGWLRQACAQSISCNLVFAHNPVGAEERDLYQLLWTSGLLIFTCNELFPAAVESSKASSFHLQRALFQMLRGSSSLSTKRSYPAAVVSPKAFSSHLQRTIIQQLWSLPGHLLITAAGHICRRPYSLQAM